MQTILLGNSMYNFKFCGNKQCELAPFLLFLWKWTVTKAFNWAWLPLN